MRRYLIASLLLAGAFAASASGQSVRWAVPPTYTSIRQLNDRLFAFREGGQTGLMDRTGKEMLPFRADSITDFSVRRALILSYDNGKFEVTGILNEDDLTVVEPSSKQKIYLGEFPIFSEGLVPVCNDKGQYGYMDENGQVVINFKYSSAAPFSEGFALVSTGKGVVDLVKGLFSKSEPLTYINKKGAELKLDRKLGQIYFGTSFFGDRATVQAKDGSYYVIDQYGRIKEARKNVSDLKLDEYLRETKDGARLTRYIEYDGPEAFAEAGRYGYRSGGRTLVLPQFFYAGSFSGGYAVAATSRNSFGMLQLVPGETQVVQRQGYSLEGVGDGEEAVGYTVHLPEAYGQDEILFSIIPSAGPRVELKEDSRGKTSRDFAVKLPLNDRTVEVLSGDGILLYRSVFGPAEAPAELAVSVVPVVKRANENNNFAFDVVFSNPGRLPVTVPISITGKNVSCKENSVTVPAGEKVRVRGTCTKVERSENRSISIAVGEKTVRKSIAVKPIVGN